MKIFFLCWVLSFARLIEGLLGVFSLGMVQVPLSRRGPDGRSGSLEPEDFECAVSRRLFHAVAVKPKGMRELKYAAFNYHVFACDVEQARAALDERLTFVPLHVRVTEVPSDDGIRPLVLGNSIAMWTPARLREAQGEPEVVAAAPRAPALSSRKLRDTQLRVLQALQNHGKYPAAWEWGTPSGTRAVLEGLRQRCLVDLHDGVYTVSAAGEAACMAAA